MKTLTTYADETLARIVHDYLVESGIDCQIVGAKEYTSHVLGGGRGRYELLVKPEQFLEAEKLLREKNNLQLASNEPLNTPNYFNRAVLFAALAPFMFPVIFNVVSLINARIYWKSSEKDASVVMKVIFILLLQIAGLLLGWHIFTWMFGPLN